MLHWFLIFLKYDYESPWVRNWKNWQYCKVLAECDESGARNQTGFKTQLAEWNCMGRCMQYQETGSNYTDIKQVTFLVLRNKKSVITLLPVVYPGYGTSPKIRTLECLQKSKVELGLLLYSRFSDEEGCFPDMQPTLCIAQCHNITCSYMQFFSLYSVYHF